MAGKQINSMVNEDMTRSVTMVVKDMQWQSSPAGHVIRKRFHLVGEPESGQVTSLVRYQPGAKFPRHGHPGGEEILVLDGTFSDQSGDWGVGYYLLNPEGFEHAPFSKDGCLIFVKLRQYSGTEHYTLQTGEIEPIKSDLGNRRMLHSGQGQSTYLLDLDTEGSFCCINGGLEAFVLSGELKVDEQRLGQHDWFRIAPGDERTVCASACSLYVKEGAVGDLRSIVNVE